MENSGVNWQIKAIHNRREFEDYRLEKTSTAVPYISLHNLCVLRGLIMSGYREVIHHYNIIAWYTLGKVNNCFKQLLTLASVYQAIYDE